MEENNAETPGLRIFMRRIYRAVRGLAASRAKPRERVSGIAIGCSAIGPADPTQLWLAPAARVEHIPELLQLLFRPLAAEPLEVLNSKLYRRQVGDMRRAKQVPIRLA